MQFVQYVSGLAVVSALQEIIDQSSGVPGSLESFPVRLKWPNDIYVQTSDQGLLKIGGVLVTAVHQGSDICACVGLGLNVSNREPTTCVHSVLEDIIGVSKSSSQLQSDASRERILAIFLSHLEELIQVQSTFRCSSRRSDNVRAHLCTDVVKGCCVAGSPTAGIQCVA